MSHVQSSARRGFEPGTLRITLPSPLGSAASEEPTAAVAAAEALKAPRDTRDPPPRTPRIVEQPGSFYTTFDETSVQLKCVARGDPVPDLYWIKNGRNMTSCESPKFSFIPLSPSLSSR